MASCKKDEIPVYGNISGVYFDGNNISFSFMEKPNSVMDTVRLSASITGMATETNRTFKAEVVKDSTTAPEELYEILDGTVAANNYKGLLPIVLKKSDILKDSIVKLTIRLLPTEDFPEIRLGEELFSIYFTAKVIKPANWDDYLFYSFGEYSTIWWTKIMEWTNRGSLPYWPENADHETWWMTYNDIQIYKRLVAEKLKEYNASSEGPLIHDDGPLAGSPVEMK